MGAIEVDLVDSGGENISENDEERVQRRKMAGRSRVEALVKVCRFPIYAARSSYMKGREGLSRGSMIFIKYLFANCCATAKARMIMC